MSQIIAASTNEDKLIIEESKLQDLFTFQFSYNFDQLKTILKTVIDRLNSQQDQISSLDKTVASHSNLVFQDYQQNSNQYSTQTVTEKITELEYLGRMHSQQLMDYKTDYKEFKEKTNQTFQKHQTQLSVEQLKEATAPNLNISETEEVHLDDRDALQEAMDKMNAQVEHVRKDFLRKLNEEEDKRMRAQQRLEKKLQRAEQQLEQSQMQGFKASGDKKQINQDFDDDTKGKQMTFTRKKLNSQVQKRSKQNLDEYESITDQNEEVDPLSKEFKTQDNYFKVTPDSVLTYTKKEIAKLRNQLNSGKLERDDLFKLLADQTNRMSDLRKLITDLQTNLSNQIQESEIKVKQELQEKMAEELDKKADKEEVDRIIPMVESYEGRIKDIESLKLMIELNQAAQDERLSNLRFKMDAYETKIAIVIQKLSQLLNGQIDKTLQMSTDELAAQKKQIEESSQHNSNQGPSAGMRDLTDKVQRLYHQFDELKKSYFKKVKELDNQMSQKASKEQLNATEKKLVDILELTFAQLGEKFASKPATQEQLFKLKSQLKSIFELLLSTGVISLDEENQDETAMFLKKPMGGFSCASCDSKLKNVSAQPGQFNQWKKLPNRDPMDRLPRAGQGFSKILQNIKNPKDLEWEDGQPIQLINPPHNMSRQNKLSKSHILIPQAIHPNQNVEANNEYFNNNLPKLTTPRKIE